MALADLEPHEIVALKFSGAMLGEYLDELGITDLAKLTAEQFNQLLYVVTKNYNNKRSEYCPF